MGLVIIGSQHMTNGHNPCLQECCSIHLWSSYGGVGQGSGQSVAVDVMVEMFAPEGELNPSRWFLWRCVALLIPAA